MDEVTRDADPAAVCPAAGSLAGRAARSGLLGAAATAVAIVLFGWEPREMILGAVVGTVIWAATMYGMEVRRLVPSGPLRPLPDDVDPNAEGEPSRWRGLPMLAFVIAAALLLAWLADSLDVGAALLPGQLAGYALAELIGVFLIRRWERSQSQRWYVDFDQGDDPVLYAGR